MSCATCTKLLSINEPTESCKKTRPKVTEIRIGCEEDVIETIAASTGTLCDVGYIDSIIAADAIGNPSPLINVPIFNEQDFDESDAFTFDRDTDTGEDTYSINPGVRVFNDDHQCTLDSLKGQDLYVLFKIEGRDGDFIWRRFKGKLTAIDGGLIAGYTLTIDTVDPAEEDKPLWVNFGTASATTTAIDTLTTF